MRRSSSSTNPPRRSSRAAVVTNQATGVPEKKEVSSSGRSRAAKKTVDYKPKPQVYQDDTREKITIKRPSKSAKAKRKEEGLSVRVGTITAADIKKGRDAKGLFRVPSKPIREKLLVEAGKAIGKRESLSFPLYGGRPWTCRVTLKEDPSLPKSKARAGPLFRWFRGKVELAVLPHLLEDIPERYYEEDEDEKNYYSLEERRSNRYSEESLNDANIPIVEKVWISPMLDIFRKRSSAEAASEVLLKQEKVIDKVIFGYGKGGSLLKPRKQTRSQALEAGMYRFLRDGLWVIGQEDSWQAANLEELNRRAALGLDDNSKDTENKKMRPAECFYFCRREVVRDLKIKEMAANGVPKKEQRYLLSEATNDLRGIWKLMTPQQKQSWTFEVEIVHEIVQNFNILLSEILGEPSQFTVGTPTFNAVANKKSDMNEPTTAEDIDSSLKAIFFPSNDDNVAIVSSTDGSCEGDNHTGPFSCLQASESQSNVYINDKENNSAVYKDKIFKTGKWLTALCVLQPKFEKESAANPLLSVIKRVARPDDILKLVSITMMKQTVTKCPIKEIGVVENVAKAKEKVGQSCRVFSVADDVWYSGVCTSYCEDSNIHYVKCGKKVKEVILGADAVIWEQSRVIASSSHWRLKPKQIEACNKAWSEHYDNVMNTVKARGLYNELQEGFDVLRERGRGRYDMTIPAFDTPEFAFLSDEEAPWMAVVKKILGEQVTLIHKGCFVSMPGADAQIYHQDGVHLSEKTQRPCYAVNVFIPLVDITLKNGPTEFCLGTHLLGNDMYNRENLEVPLPKAGTPFLFDYRTGHRGLANSSDDPRPILYLTYTAQGFKDTTNFSRSRYRKIGDFVEKSLTREERFQRRMEQQWAEGKEAAIAASSKVDNNDDIGENASRTEVSKVNSIDTKDSAIKEVNSKDEQKMIAVGSSKGKQETFVQEVCQSSGEIKKSLPSSASQKRQFSAITQQMLAPPQVGMLNNMNMFNSTGSYNPTLQHQMMVPRVYNGGLFATGPSQQAVHVFPPPFSQNYFQRGFNSFTNMAPNEQAPSYQEQQCHTDKKQKNSDTFK